MPSLAFVDVIAAPRAPRLAADHPPHTATADDEEWDGIEVTGDVTAADLRRIDAHDVLVRRLRASGTAFDEARVADAVLDGCELSGASLDDAQLRRVRIDDCRASGASISEAKLHDVILRGTRADDLTFRFTHLERVCFDGCDLQRADFTGATLVDVALYDCDLRAAVFTGATTTRLALHGSRLDGLVGALSLRGAAIEGDQVVPLGLLVLLALGTSIGPRPDADPVAGSDAGRGAETVGDDRR